MSRQHKNYIRNFEKIGYTLDAYSKDHNTMTFTCDNGHTSTLSIGSVVNNFSIHNRKGVPVCGECKCHSAIMAKYQALVDKHGFTIINVEHGGGIVYKCKCGEIRHAHRSNMRRTKGSCAKCMNDKTGIQLKV